MATHLPVSGRPDDNVLDRCSGYHPEDIRDVTVHGRTAWLNPKMYWAS
jgi:hypothetical protein